MKCKRSIPLLALVITLALIPAGMAQPKKAIKCTHDIKFNGALGIWFGTVTFPNGNVYDLIWYIDLTPEFVGHKKSPVFPDGKVEKFYETWELYPEDSYDPLEPDLTHLESYDVLLAGWDKGIFDADSWRYVMNGAVTAADGELAYLEGARMRASGVAELLDTFYGEGIFTFTGYVGW